MTADVFVHPSAARGRQRMAARRGLPVGSIVSPAQYHHADWRSSLFSNELDHLKVQYAAIRERLPLDHPFRTVSDWAAVAQEPHNPLWMAMDKCLSLIRNIEDKLERGELHTLADILLLLDTEIVRFDDAATYYLAQQ